MDILKTRYLDEKQFPFIRDNFKVGSRVYVVSSLRSAVSLSAVLGCNHWRVLGSAQWSSYTASSFCVRTELACTKLIIMASTGQKWSSGFKNNLDVCVDFCGCSCCSHWLLCLLFFFCCYCCCYYYPKGYIEQCQPALALQCLNTKAVPKYSSKVSLQACLSILVGVEVTLFASALFS